MCRLCCTYMVDRLKPNMPPQIFFSIILNRADKFFHLFTQHTFIKYWVQVFACENQNSCKDNLKNNLSEISYGSSAFFLEGKDALLHSVQHTKLLPVAEQLFSIVYFFFSLSPRVNHRFELLHTNCLRTPVGISLARSRGGIHGQGIDRTKAFVL